MQPVFDLGKGGTGIGVPRFEPLWGWALSKLLSNLATPGVSNVYMLGLHNNYNFISVPMPKIQF